MKIEMGESLGASWLRHVKKCVLVQTNWKPSPFYDHCDMKVVEGLYNDAKKFFTENGIDVFKQNASVEQLIGQTECDVIGISLNKEGAHFEALEVAFHEQGLDYGSKQETAAKVAAKMLRIGFCLYGYMKSNSANISFASPKVHKATLELLLPALKMVTEFFSARGFEFTFELLVNDDFCDKMLKPVIKCGLQVSDTSELFLRSMQLAGMFGLNVVGNPKVTKVHLAIKKVVEIDGDKPSESIGSYARRVLWPILKALPTEDIANFCDKEWCKFTFGLNFPVLSKMKIVIHGRSRSYSEAHKLIDGVYYMTNDWYEKNRGPLDAWLRSHTDDPTNLK